MKYCVLLLLIFCLSSGKENDYLSPGEMAADENRNLVYTALTTAKAIAISDLKTGQTTGIIALRQNPNGILLSPDGLTLFISCGKEKGCVEQFCLPEKKRKTTVETGHTPQSMALSNDGKLLFVANRFSNAVSVIDLPENRVVASIPAVREPNTLCMSPDGKTLAVANFLPAQASSDSVVAAKITLIDVQTRSVKTHVTLENGAQSVVGLAISKDGKYLYAVHLLSRFGVPVTQLTRGWVNTNALSIIDLKTNSVYATLLLDDTDNGAANPAGICIGNDRKLYITLSGTHELMILDKNALHENIEALSTGKNKDSYIQNKNDLSASLSFTSPCKKRIRLQGKSPREVIVTQGKILVSSLFSPFLEQIPVTGNQIPVALPLGNEPPPDAERRGKLAFNDASICFQQWQSCASCHPDGRADGLNWDQQNDGLGNPKNTKSLLYSYLTEPCMITGIRESAEKAVRNGILHTLQTSQPESFASDMDEYLKHLTPLESPFSAEYRKKDPRQKGKALFKQTGCLQCHTGKYLTDMKMYDAGTGDGNDRERPFDTPSLCEIWRTAPYLYDGRAATLEEVFTTWNMNDRHGVTNNLSKEELAALILYLKTL